MAKSFKLLDKGQHPDVPSTSESSEERPIDWNKCILCQKDTKETLSCPANLKKSDSDISTAYANIASNLVKFKQLGELHDGINLEALDNGTGIAATLKYNAAKWHKKCKDNYNTTKVRRAEKRKAKETEDEPKAVSPKRTRFSSSGAARTSQDTCFFCGDPGELHKASTAKLDANVRRCAETVKDYILIGKLSAGDMMSQDAMYHSKCLKALYKKAEKVNQSESKDNTFKQLQGIALAELLAYIEDCRSESLENNQAPMFKLADLNQMYMTRLNDLGAETTSRMHSTRLKERILANIPDMQAHKQGRDVYLVFTDDVGLALKKALDSDYDEEAIVLAKAAEIVRRDILKHDKSDFEGKFTTNCQQQSVLQSLMSLVGMIMTGPNIEQQSSNATDTQAMLTVSQLVRYNLIIRRRVGSSSQYHSVEREPPLPIYLGLLVHARTRKRGLIDKMCELGLSIPYNRVLSISTDLGNSVCSRYEAEHVVCPTNLRLGLFTTSAVDNIDHNPTSATAQGSFHGTGISIFQHPSKNALGEEREIPEIPHNHPKQNKLANLPEEYSSILPAVLHTKEPEVPEIILPPVPCDARSKAMQDDER